MPYEDEPHPSSKASALSPDLERATHDVIGAAIEVHRHLGPGLPEEAYHAAMRIELEIRGIAYESQKVVDVLYKGHRVAKAKIDLFVVGQLVVELKSIETIGPIQRLQTRTYIRMLNKSLGLVINFNVPTLREGIRRVIETDHIN